MRIDGNSTQNPTTNVYPAEAVSGPAAVTPQSHHQPERGSGSEAPERLDLEQYVEKMNETARIFNTALKFQIATDKSIVIQVVDTESGEVLKEIPPGKLVDAFRRMEQTLGLLVDQRV